MSRKIYIIGEINMEAYQKFSEQLTEFENDASENADVEIELCSEGGEAYAALAFAGRMLRTPCALNVKAYGLVASAAVLILACGGSRALSSEAWVMVHEDEGTLEGNVSLVEIQAKHGRRLENQWNNLLEELTNTPAEKWAELNKETTYLSPAECLELGLIDEII